MLGVVLVPAAICTLKPAHGEMNAFDQEAVIAAHGFAPHQVGFYAIDLETGAVLGQRNADAAFIPASVTKVPTTVAALATLGPGYRFETALYGTGPVVDGRLDGDLYLVGGGDPILNADDLDGVLAEAVESGIGGVSGALHYDASLLPQVTAIDPQQPETATYNPGVSALSVNFNVIQVAWETDAADGTLSVTATSNTDSQRVPVDSVLFAVAPETRPQRTSFRQGDQADGEVWVLARHLPPEGHDWLPVQSTALNTAMVFRRLAEARGLTLPAASAAALPEDARLLARHRSAPLTRIVRGVLRYSNNLSAELVGLVASRRLVGEALSLTDSAQTLDGWLQQHVEPIDWGPYRAVNHSGLATQARATPRQMVEILRYAESLDLGEDGYADLLPTVAVPEPEDGSRRTPAVEVRAKSGTLYYGSGLAGYMLTGGEARIAFAVFVSDLEARQRLDSAEDPSARDNPPGVRHWLARARAVQRALLSHWAEAPVMIARR